MLPYQGFDRFVTGVFMISSFVLLCALYIANPVLFFDDFNDKELPSWRSDGHIGVKDGKLLLGNNADLLIEVRDALRWEDYTTTLRFRFLVAERTAVFNIDVRTSLGPFNVWTAQSVSISPGDGNIIVYTIRQENPAFDHLDPAIVRGKAKQIFELGRWYNLSIEILDNNFTIFLDNRELIAFADRDTLPGTVSLATGFAQILPNGESVGRIRVEIDMIRVAEETVERLSVESGKRLITTTWAAVKDGKVSRQ